MRNFIQKISSLSTRAEAFDQIVHLGAGQHAEPSDYAGLRYRRLVLVEGDPEAAETLSTACEEDPSVQVIQKMISPTGGEVRFYRYNLSAMNGVLAAGGLTSLYPRLRVLGEERLSSSTLASVIEELEIDAQKRNLLILDLPGQEASLIVSLTKEQLRKFEYILIRGCKESLQNGAQTLQQTLALLKKSHYALIEEDKEEDPHWPIILLKYDGAIAEIEEELQNRARLLVEKATQIHQQGERIAELVRVVGEVSAQRDGLHGEVAAVRSELEQSHAQHGTLQHRISDLESDVLSKETLLDVLSKGRVQQDRMYEELSEERDSLQKQIETLEASLRELELQIQERDGKSLLVDAEFQKVEGQMEIIKEIFLRGNSLK